MGSSSPYNLLLGDQGKKQIPAQPQSQLDWLGNVAQSTLWGIPEVFGFEPPENVREFRARDPIGGTVSELIGYGLPYIGAYQLSKLPKFAKYLKFADEIAKGGRPIVAGALRETAQMAPLEAARLLIGPTVGGATLSEMLSSNVTSLGLEAAFGAFGGALSKSGTGRVRTQGILDLTETAPSYDLNLMDVKRGLDTRLPQIAAEAGVESPAYGQMLSLNNSLDKYLRTRVPGMRDVRGLQETLAKVGRETDEDGMLADLFEEDMAKMLRSVEPINKETPIRKALRTRELGVAELDPILGTTPDTPWVRTLKVVDGIHDKKQGALSPVSIRLGIEDADYGFSSIAARNARHEALGHNVDTISGIDYEQRFITTVYDSNKESPIKKLADRNFVSAGDGSYWGREINGGKYHVLRKVPVSRKLSAEEYLARTGKELPEGKAIEEWYFAATGNPDATLNIPARMLNEAVKSTAWARPPGVSIKGAAPLWDSLQNYMDNVSLNKYFDRIRPGMGAAKRTEVLAEIAPKLRGEPRLLESVRKSLDYFTPTLFELRENKLTRQLFGGIRWTNDIMVQQAERILQGEVKFEPAKGIWRQSFVGPEPAEGSLLRLWQKLNPADMAHVNKWREAPMESIRDAYERKVISDRAFKFFDALDQRDAALLSERRATNRAAGLIMEENELVGRKLIGRRYQGDFRAPIYDTDKGELVYMMAGNDAAQLDRDALQYVAKRKRDFGEKLRADEVRPRDDDYYNNPLFQRQIEEMRRSPEFSSYRKTHEELGVRTMRPKTFRQRTDVDGYIKEFTKEELWQAIEHSVRERVRYNGTVAMNAILGPAVEAMSLFGDARAVNRVLRRMDDVAGKSGSFVQGINKGFDKLLAPVLGKDSASKISHAMAAGLGHMTLGFFKLSFIGIQFAQILQTGLPHLSLYTRNPAKWYSAISDMGYIPDKFGRPFRTIAKVSPLKLVYQGVKTATHPDEQALRLINRAWGDGILVGLPREIYENLTKTGRSRDAVQAVKELKFSESILELSKLGIAGPERMTRLHAFTTALEAGRKVAGIVDEDYLYASAKELMDRMMYRYAKADKAQLFHGPLGSTFGLFKNWSTHYIASMWEFGKLFGKGLRTMDLDLMTPLLWAAAGNTLVGGLRAAPFYAVADGFSRMVSDKGLMQHIYDNLNIKEKDGSENTWLSDAAFMGLPSLLGISLSSQANAPFNNPLRDASSLFSLVHLDRAKALGNAIAAYGDRMDATGELFALQFPDVRDKFVKALAPVTVYRTLSTLAGSDEIRSLSSGYPQMKGLNLADIILYRAGLNSKEVQKRFEVQNAIWEDVNAHRAEIARYGEAWAKAEEEGNSKLLDEILNRAIYRGLDLDAIFRSARTRLQRAEGDALSRYSVEQLLPYQSILGR